MRVFVSLALGLLASLVVVAIMTLGRAPWNFYLGGHFHPRGGWQGKGTLHSTAAGGDHTMWIQLDGQRGHGSRGPILNGSGVLCSPRGEHLPLNVWAYALRGHGADLTGVPLHVKMNRWMPFALSAADRNPQLDFQGTFGADVLILEDHGSVGTAFGPDGAVRETPTRTPSSVENIRVTFERSTLSRLPDGCVI